MDWLNDLLARGKTVLVDVGSAALGVQRPSAPTQQAATKGTDTTARNTDESMPRYLWLVLADVIVVLVAFARRR